MGRDLTACPVVYLQQCAFLTGERGILSDQKQSAGRGRVSQPDSLVEIAGGVSSQIPPGCKQEMHQRAEGLDAADFCAGALAAAEDLACAAAASSIAL